MRDVITDTYFSFLAVRLASEKVHLILDSVGKCTTFELCLKETELHTECFHLRIKLWYKLVFAL